MDSASHTVKREGGHILTQGLLMGMLFLERNRERVAFILFISFFYYIIPHSFIKSGLPSLPVFQPASQFHNFVLFIEDRNPYSLNER